MKHNDIDQLLNGLLGGQTAPKPTEKNAPPPPPPAEDPKRSAASEDARRRVEEIMRRVEQESSMKKAGEPQKRQDMTIPKREPVQVPPPVSHFTDEPSQNPAVRMRDRLDETALPMLDAERKPNQIIEPKPKPEQTQKPRKKKKCPQNPDAQKKQTQKPSASAQAASADIPAPQKEQKRTVPHINIPDELPPDIPREPQPVPEEPKPVPEVPQEKPKRKIMHINIPDELPPDIPREPQPVPEEPKPVPEVPQEKPKRKIMHINIPDELPPDIPRDTTIADELRRKREEQQAEPAEAAEPAQPEAAPEPKRTAEDDAFLKKAESIRQQIRNAMDEIKAVPDPVDMDETENEAVPEASPEEPEEEQPAAEDAPKKSRFGGMFRRKQAEEETAETAPEELTVQEEAPAEEPAEEAAVSEAAEEVPETPASAPAAPKLRHLSAMDEPKEKQGFFSRFSRKKKQNLTEHEEIDLSENIEVPLEMPEETPVSKRSFFQKREKILLIPEPVEYDDVPEDEPEDEPEKTAAEMIPQETAAPELPPEPETPAEPAVKPEASIDVTLEKQEETPQKKGFAAAVHAAFDENVQELADVKAEPIPAEQPARSHRTFRRRTYLITGVLCSVFAVVGAVTCVAFAVQAVQRFTASSSLKSKLEDVLYPVAVVDLPEFENPEDAAPEALLSAAMIDLLMYGDLSQYQEVFDTISIPAEDIHSRTAEMFGVEITSAPETLYAAGEIFFYDESTGSYNVPSSPVIFSYAPDITEIRRSGEEYVVTVVYRSDIAQWQERSENFTQTSEKTMEIALYKESGGYRIARIMNVSEHSDGI